MLIPRRLLLSILCVLGAVGLILPAGASAASHHKQAKKPPLAGKYFWRTIYHPDYAWDNKALYFIDSKWAYRGFAKHGLPTGCKRVTVKKKDGDGCVRYRLSRGGTLTVGGKHGSFRSGKLKVSGDGVVWDQLATPKRGARYALKLSNVGYRGICGVYSFCSLFYKNLALNKQGQFILSDSAVTSVDTGDTFAMGGSFPPDQYGTYEVLKHGQIKLTFANGSVSRRTLGIGLSKSRKPDAINTGVVLGETNFYVDD